MKKQISLKWKIGRYLLVFAVLVIAVIFVFQILLLEPMYEQSKAATIMNVSDNVMDAIENDYGNDYIGKLALQSDTCVMTYIDSSSSPITSRVIAGNGGCLFYSMSAENISSYVDKAADNGGAYLTKVDQSQLGSRHGFQMQDDVITNIVYTKIAESGDINYVVIVSGVITPLSATIQTLSHQLLYIGLFLTAAIFFLPLARINEAAKELSSGRYNPDPTTDRYKEAQELNLTLTKAADEIQAADKAKRDLIANVSHDLRTPLTMISGYGEMMQDLPEEKTDENLQVIIDESRRLNQLVNDLLDLSKLQSSQIELHKEEVDLTSLVAMQMRKYDVYTVQDGFTIEKDLKGEAVIEADPKRLEQVFNNFMTNAINYSGEKKHIIVRELLDDKTVTIEVQDFGEGIPEDKLDKVWDRYYKIDKTHVRVSNGSGIGLALCKEILDLHGVQYGVRSKVGEGSTFWFRFNLVSQKA